MIICMFKVDAVTHLMQSLIRFFMVKISTIFVILLRDLSQPTPQFSWWLGTDWIKCPERLTKFSTFKFGNNNILKQFISLNRCLYLFNPSFMYLLYRYVLPLSGKDLFYTFTDPSESFELEVFNFVCQFEDDAYFVYHFYRSTTFLYFDWFSQWIKCSF